MTAEHSTHCVHKQSELIMYQPEVLFDVDLCVVMQLSAGV